jgi:MOSC domain-containing protein YiiM
MVKRFFDSRRTGFYLAVTREGDVGAGDELIMLSRDPDSVPVSDITHFYAEKNYGVEDLRRLKRALRIAALPGSWKEYLEQKLNSVGA